MDSEERHEINKLLDEWEEAKIEMEEGESKMTLAESELEVLGVDDPSTYKLPEEE